MTHTYAISAENSSSDAQPRLVVKSASCGISESLPAGFAFFGITVNTNNADIKTSTTERRAAA